MTEDRPSDRSVAVIHGYRYFGHDSVATVWQVSLY